MPHCRRNYPRCHFVGAQLVKRAGDGLVEPCVTLDDESEFLRPAVLSWLIICSSEPRMPRRRSSALLAGAVTVSSRATFGLHHREAVTGVRVPVKPNTSTERRTSVHGLAGVTHERAHAAPFGAGNDDVADA